MNNPPDILLNVCVLSPDMGTLAAVWSIFVITPATFSLFSRSPEDWRDNNNIIETKVAKEPLWELSHFWMSG